MNPPERRGRLRSNGSEGGKIHQYLRDKVLSGEKIHLSLIDPDKAVDINQLMEVEKE